MSDTSNRFKPHADYAKLQELFPHIRRLQALADDHGVTDIFQDNGGKLLQLALLLGIKLLGEREGNDAVDVTTAGEFEMKTVNINKRRSFTTHHHLNHVILSKYRKVEWVFATYRTIELERVWLMQPDKLEPYFADWERQLGTLNKKGEPRSHLNNPQIPISHVEQYGRLIHGPPVVSQTTAETVDPFSRSRTYMLAIADPPFTAATRRGRKK